MTAFDGHPGDGGVHAPVVLGVKGRTPGRTPAGPPKRARLTSATPPWVNDLMKEVSHVMVKLTLLVYVLLACTVTPSRVYVDDET